MNPLADIKAKMQYWVEETPSTYIIHQHARAVLDFLEKLETNQIFIFVQKDERRYILNGQLIGDTELAVEFMRHMAAFEPVREGAHFAVCHLGIPDDA